MRFQILHLINDHKSRKNFGKSPKAIGFSEDADYLTTFIAHSYNSKID